MRREVIEDALLERGFEQTSEGWYRYFGRAEAAVHFTPSGVKIAARWPPHGSTPGFKPNEATEWSLRFGDAVLKALDYSIGQAERMDARFRREVEEAMWAGDQERLHDLAPCNCCCSEHTSSWCLARLWGGCRGGDGSDEIDVEGWASHYKMTRDEFENPVSEDPYREPARPAELDEGFDDDNGGFEGYGWHAKYQKRRGRKLCARCGATATIVAHDYPGPGTPYCYYCRQQLNSGADNWPYTGIAWGAGPKNGRSRRTAISLARGEHEPDQ